MEYKTAELEGPLLDAAVGKAEGLKVERGIGGALFVEGRTAGGISEYGPDPNQDFSPSIEWHDGGPIIERERITMGFCGDDNPRWPGQWFAQYGTERDSDALRANFHSTGPAPLIAAMRAYVASKFGETIELP